MNEPVDEAVAKGPAAKQKERTSSEDATSVPGEDVAGSSARTTPQREPAYCKRSNKRGNEVCQLLIRRGDGSPVSVRQALKIQEELGGQIGRILVRLGACTEEALARALLEQLAIQRKEGATNISLAARENPA